MIDFVTLDVEQTKADMIASFEDSLEQTLYPSDEKMIFLMQFMPIAIAIVAQINVSANQNLLRYARGPMLDAIGYLTSTERLLASSSGTYLKISLSAAQAQDVQIPIGTRATPNFELYFETTESSFIPAGQSFVTIPAKCSAAGEIGNGFEMGQIKYMVDQIPFVESVTNTVATSGGTNDEEDDPYRERIRLSPESFTTAGSEDAYIYWAKTADVNIGDVKTDSPSDATVKIIVLMKDGTLPTQTILDKVTAATSPKNRRPITDHVTAEAPTEVNYNINYTWYISKDRETEVNAITSAVNQARVDYIAWQSSKLGRAISPDELRKRLLIAGASRLEIVAPAYAPITDLQVARLGTVITTYGGLE